MNQIPPRTSTAVFSQPDLLVYVRMGWRWLWLIVLVALLAGGAAYLFTRNMTPIYQASATLMIKTGRGASGDSYANYLTDEKAGRTYSDLMKRASVMRQVFTRLGLEPSLVKKQIATISVNPVRDTQLLQLAVDGPNPELVAAVANTLPQVFLDELRQIQSSRYAESKASLSEQLDQLTRQIETTKLQLTEIAEQRTAQEQLEFSRLSNALTQYETSYANLLQSFEQLRLAEAESSDTIVIMEPAAVPDAPVRPRLLYNVLLALVVGALAALGVVFLIEYLDDRVQTPEDLRRIVDTPVLGAIAQLPSNKVKSGGAEHLISIGEPRHPVVEAYRRLRTNLQFYNIDAGLKSIVVTSSVASEGKSSTSANLAVVMAQSGLSVVLVDADLRKPKQHTNFGLPRRPGLAEALVTGQVADSALQPVANVPTLRVLTAGESVPNPAELLGSQRMRQLMQQLAEQVDIILYDTPPLLAVTDAQVIGHLADGALLVINTHKTAGAAVHRAVEALIQAKVPLMGVVLNRLSTASHGYYYYYYHDYAQAADGADGKGRKKRKSRSSKPQPAPELAAAEAQVDP